MNVIIIELLDHLSTHGKYQSKQPLKMFLKNSLCEKYVFLKVARWIFS